MAPVPPARAPPLEPRPRALTRPLRQTFPSMQSTSILVINLDRSPARMQRTREQLEQLGLAFERVPAVEGTALSPAEVHRHYDERLNRRGHHTAMTPGEIGCYCSHLKAWQLILERRLPHAIILEDDVELGRDFAHAVRQIAQLPPGWDVVKLGAVKRRPVLQQQTQGRLHLCHYTKAPISAFAQAVSYDGAQKLVASRRRFGRPVDVDLQYEWETGVSVLGLEPFPVRVRSGVPSDIGDKPRRHLVGQNSCLRLYFHRLRLAARINSSNYLKHGILKTALARPFHGVEKAPSTFLPAGGQARTPVSL
jgi:glycosyl transferase family 25